MCDVPSLHDGSRSIWSWESGGFLLALLEMCRVSTILQGFQSAILTVWRETKERDRLGLNFT